MFKSCFRQVTLSRHVDVSFVKSRLMGGVFDVPSSRRLEEWMVGGGDGEEPAEALDEILELLKVSGPEGTVAVVLSRHMSRFCLVI